MNGSNNQSSTGLKVQVDTSKAYYLESRVPVDLSSSERAASGKNNYSLNSEINLYGKNNAIYAGQSITSKLIGGSDRKTSVDAAYSAGAIVNFGVPNRVLASEEQKSNEMARRPEKEEIYNGSTNSKILKSDPATTGTRCELNLGCNLLNS